MKVRPELSRNFLVRIFVKYSTQSRIDFFTSILRCCDNSLPLKRIIALYGLYNLTDSETLCTTTLQNKVLLHV